jgi:hypothetical protein
VGRYLHVRIVSGALAEHWPLAHIVVLVQYAPAGARHVPPVQAVPSGQSALLEQVRQLPLLQKCVMQDFAEHASPPAAAHVSLLTEHTAPEQSLLAPHG